MNKRIVIAALTLILLSCFSGGVVFAGADELDGKIAFLRDGEICLSDIDGSDIEILTQTNGKVIDFRFSPGLEYLAYTKVVGMVDDIGLYEDGEDVPKTEIWSIVIVQLPTMKALVAIEPGGEWLNLVQWTAFDRLMYYSSSGYDVSGFYQYDIGGHKSTAFDYQEGHRMLYADYSQDYRLRSYVDDTGRGESFTDRLHIVDLQTTEDRVVATKKGIRNHSVSSDGRHAAFVEIQPADSGNVAVIWVCSLERDSLEQVAILPAKTRGNSTMSWSVDDGCIGVFYAPSHRPNGYIVPLAHASDMHEISGKQFCWVSDRAILYSRGAADIYLYDLDAREEKLFIEGATHPTYLLRSK